MKIKGRYFFWVPLFIYVLYLLYPIMIEYKQTVISALIIITGIHAALSVVAGGIYIYNDDSDKEEMIEYIIECKSFFILIPYFYIIAGINYFFDKYLTINK